VIDPGSTMFWQIVSVCAPQNGQIFSTKIAAAEINRVYQNLYSLIWIVSLDRCAI
jgi:hypothetical protein